MLERLIHLCLRHRAAVILLWTGVAGAGLWSMADLSVDAFPDTTPVQVQVNVTAPALGPVEIERQGVWPVERALTGLPGVVEVRSVNRFGYGQVVAVFEDGTDLWFARQVVSERLAGMELPPGVSAPAMGPPATGLGEIFHYVVTGDGFSLEQLTTIHDWQIAPRLAGVPGVAEVNTWGGSLREFQVRVDPSHLAARDLTLDDLVDALRDNNINTGGGNLVRAGELHVVQGVALVEDLAEIGAIPVATRDGTPILVRDVAEPTIGAPVRRGAVTYAGEGEVVLGLGFLMIGENSFDVTHALDDRLAEIRADLPEGVDVTVVYRRTDLVESVLATVRTNLLEGALLVVAILFIFLGNLRAGLIVALAIPLSMLCAFSLMLQVGIAASLMSLGAIDFGLIVDSSVIQVENAERRLHMEGDRRAVLDIVRDAAVEVRRPTLFGEMIITIVYLPILALEGIEGRLFRPMALTVIFALVGSLLISLTLMPVLASLALRKGGGKRRRNPVVVLAETLYRPVLAVALRLRLPVIAGALAVIGGTVWLASGLGSEFIPRLSEGGVVVNTIRLSGVSLDESVRYGTRIEKVLLEEFPDEIEHIWTRTGTGQTATDPMGIEVSDVFIELTPRDTWTRADSQAGLVDAMDAVLAGMPGMRRVFTQPIEMRVNEMVAGIRTDVGVKIFGHDLDVLRDKAAEVQAVLEEVEGAADIYTEQVTGQPVLDIRVDRNALARHGIPARHVLEVVEALGGITVGQVIEGERRSNLVVRLDEHLRDDPEAVGRILVPAPDGSRVPLSELTVIRHTEGPAAINREWQHRRITVQCNVRGRDTAGFVKEARRRIAEEVELPAGMYVEFGGQFEHLERARLRLMIVVPVALLLILVLLHASTGGIRETLLIFTAAPFAAVGGVLALWLRGMPFTISAGVGFVAVSGVAMLAGLVLISTIQQRLRDGLPLAEAVRDSAMTRLRPVLMTALVAGLGFVPMAFNTGIGAEVQRPLATVVVAGVITANILTLVVLPALCTTFGLRARD